MGIVSWAGLVVREAPQVLTGVGNASYLIRATPGRFWYVSLRYHETRYHETRYHETETCVSSLHDNSNLLTSRTKRCPALRLSAHTPKIRTGRPRGRTGLPPPPAMLEAPSAPWGPCDSLPLWCGSDDDAPQRRQDQKPSGTGRPTFTSATKLTRHVCQRGDR